jgi:hypothetical protein
LGRSGTMIRFPSPIGTTAEVAMYLLDGKRTRTKLLTAE